MPYGRCSDGVLIVFVIDDGIDNRDAGSEEDVAPQLTETAPQQTAEAPQTKEAPQTGATPQNVVTPQTEVIPQTEDAPSAENAVSIKEAIGRKYLGAVRRVPLRPKAVDKVNYD